MIYVIVTCVWHVWGGEYDLRHFITLCWLQWRVEKTHQVTCENLAWVDGAKVYAGSFERVAILVDSIYPHLMQWCQACNNYSPPHNEVVGGILVSLHPSVRPACRVHSVAPTVLIGSILYLYIFSSNFRRCVACKVSGKISKFEFLAIFLKFVTLTSSCFDLESDVNH